MNEPKDYGRHSPNYTVKELTSNDIGEEGSSKYVKDGIGFLIDVLLYSTANTMR